MKKAVNEWLRFARRDLLTAETLSRSKIFLAEPIAFHSQQAAEKAIKAFLAAHSKRFGKTHNIETLLKLVEQIDDLFAESLKPAAVLTEYAVNYRYPEAARIKLTKPKALKAIKLAKLVLQEVRSKLLKN
jgi:HEPN domain-containing protein